MEDLLGIGDPDEWLRVAIRLMVSVLLGGIIGLQREQTGKAAGLRTHMLVCLATCLFVVVSNAGVDTGDASRVIQGIATGIGFIGGGAILKLREQQEVHGLTTAASIWMTAAVGVAVGLGHLATALFSGVLTWAILAIVAKIEPRLVTGNKQNR